MTVTTSPCERCVRLVPDADLVLSDYGDARLCETCVRARAEEMSGRQTAHREANSIPQPLDSYAPGTKEDS